jgi:hypothetical protein
MFDQLAYQNELIGDATVRRSQQLRSKAKTESLRMQKGNQRYNSVQELISDKDFKKFEKVVVTHTKKNA